jgi:hypothetical protein
LFDVQNGSTVCTARLTTDGNINLIAGLLDGLPLTSGVCTFGTGISIGTELTFDAEGDPDAVFIIQTTSGSVKQSADTTTVNVVEPSIISFRRGHVSYD